MEIVLGILAGIATVAAMFFGTRLWGCWMFCR